MAAYKYLIFALALLLVSCAPESESLPERAAIKTNPLVGVWQYSHVEVQGFSFPFADFVMEPGYNKSGLGGERSVLDRRRIEYYPDGTYELKWVDRGDYRLGTEGDPNWQPSYGYYLVPENADSLYHNIGLTYEVGYTMLIEGDTLTRQHRRYMSADGFDNKGNQLWWKRNLRNYREVFIRVR